MSEGGSFGEQGSLDIAADEGAPTGAEASQDPGEAQAQLDALREVPASPEGYDLSSFEVPEALKEVWDHDLQDGVIAEMHKLGLSNAQVQGILSRYATAQEQTVSEYLTASDEAAADERANAKAQLEREWGENFERKMASVTNLFRQAAEAAGVDPEQLAGTDLPGGGLVGNNPDLMKVFAALGEGLKQAGPSVPGRTVYASSLADLDAQLAEIEGDPALHDKRDRRHAMVMLQRDLLFQQRYPEEQPTSTPPTRAGKRSRNEKGSRRRRRRNSRVRSCGSTERPCGRENTKAITLRWRGSTNSFACRASQTTTSRRSTGRQPSDAAGRAGIESVWAEGRIVLGVRLQLRGQRPHLPGAGPLLWYTRIAVPERCFGER
jgi:hypothetical protein